LLKEIPIQDIVPTKHLLRPVNKKSKDYIGILEAIRTSGFMGAIDVRPNKTKFEVVDGMHRFEAAKQLRLSSIPCNISERSDEDVMRLQIVKNLHKVETTPMQYAKRLLQISENKHLTNAQLGDMICKDKSWVSYTLQLARNITDPALIKMIDSGQIEVNTAWILARINPVTQEWIDYALTLPRHEFLVRYKSYLRNERGKFGAKEKKVFEPVATMRWMKDILKEIKEPDEILSYSMYDSMTPLDAAVMALKWVVHLDPKNLIEQENKFLARKTANDKRSSQLQ
jgi:ParB/RepB/Spo0J family partition protein